MALKKGKSAKADSTICAEAQEGRTDFNCRGCPAGRVILEELMAQIVRKIPEAVTRLERLVRPVDFPAKGSRSVQASCVCPCNLWKPARESLAGARESCFSRTVRNAPPSARTNHWPVGTGDAARSCAPNRYRDSQPYFEGSFADRASATASYAL
jgi:hypothetical protein